jgi:hypothetical protein
MTQTGMETGMETGIETGAAAARLPGKLGAGGVFRQWMMQQLASAAPVAVSSGAGTAKAGGKIPAEVAGEVPAKAAAEEGNETQGAESAGKMAGGERTQTAAPTPRKTVPMPVQCAPAQKSAQPAPEGKIAGVSGDWSAGETASAAEISDHGTAAATLSAVSATATSEVSAPAATKAPAALDSSSADAASGRVEDAPAETEKPDGLASDASLAPTAPASVRANEPIHASSPAEKAEKKSTPASTRPAAAAQPSMPVAHAQQKAAEVPAATVSTAAASGGASPMAAVPAPVSSPASPRALAKGSLPAAHSVSQPRIAPLAAAQASSAAAAASSAEPQTQTAVRPALAPAIAARESARIALAVGTGTAPTAVGKAQQHVAVSAAGTPAASPSGATAAMAPSPHSSSLPVSGSAAHGQSIAPGATFDHLDTGSAPRVLASTPRGLAVGVSDPGLGWVEIRAHAGEGQIAATLSASSAAHAALTAQLPAMREYLAGQQVRVDTLAAQPFQASADGSRHSPGQQNGEYNRSQDQGRDAPAAAETARLPGFSGESESLSWIDVRV